MSPATYPDLLDFLTRHAWKSAAVALAPWVEWLSKAGLIAGSFQPWVGAAASGFAVLGLLVSFGAYRQKADGARAIGVWIFFSLVVLTFAICLMLKLTLGSAMVPSGRWVTYLIWGVWNCAYVALFTTASMLVGVAGLRAMS